MGIIEWRRSKHALGDGAGSEEEAAESKQEELEEQTEAAIVRLSVVWPLRMHWVWLDAEVGDKRSESRDGLRSGRKATARQCRNRRIHEIRRMLHGLRARVAKPDRMDEEKAVDTNYRILANLGQTES